MTVLLADGRRLADVTPAVGQTTLDFSVGSVAELTVNAVDTGRLLPAGLLTTGTVLTYGGNPWQVAAVERDYRGEGVVCVFTARSRLARRLRNRMGPDTTKGITPAAWIGRHVKAAGGTALVQPGAKRRTIHQKRSESVLDIINTLSGDMGTEWIEWGNRLIVGTGWWALNGGPNLPTWEVTVGGPSCLSFSARTSLDDRDQAATASLTVPHELGVKLRPWHRVVIGGPVDGDDRGVWLVQDVSYGLHASETPTVGLYRPRKSAVVAKGSSSTGTGGDTTLGDGEWIDGADKVWPPCTRTPRAYVQYALNHVGQSWRANGCLAWVSVAVSGTEGRGGEYARYVWEKRPANTPTTQSRTPPIGAIVVWNGSHGGGAGHVGISIGGGRFISATGGSVRADSISGGWASGYYGAMAPRFWT